MSKLHTNSPKRVIVFRTNHIKHIFNLYCCLLIRLSALKIFWDTITHIRLIKSISDDNIFKLNSFLSARNKQPVTNLETQAVLILCSEYSLICISVIGGHKS